MRRRGHVRGRWARWCGLALAAGIVAVGCGDDLRPIKRDRPSRGPVAPAPTVTVPLPDLMQPVDHSPTMVAAPPPGYLVDAKVLVISADGGDSQLAAIEETLRYLGTPYDLIIASQAPTLTSAQLGTATHGKYNAIILTTGNLVLSNGSSAFSSAEFATLANYEATFQVRRASLYTSPDAGYGYSGSVSQDTQATPLATQCTTAGRAVFPYVNCANGVTISGAFAYRATALDGATVPLLTDASGRVLAATRDYGDGREALSLNFQQSATLVHSLQLLHGVISWATRGVFLGERHAYLGVQIDDVFLPDDIYTGGTFRIGANDLQAAAVWQNAKRAQAVTGGMRYHMVFNADGASSSDALTMRAQQLAGSFGWINHTWDHTELDPLSYNQVLSELTMNIAASDTFGLKPFSALSFVPPSYSGLTSSNAMRAMFDAGIRYVACDTSVPGYDNPSPNAGLYSPLQSQILLIPRRPNNLGYDVSTPDQWMAEYNNTYRSFWGRDLNYDEILDAESDVLLQYLLKGENDPWMFHQPDLRAYDGTRSLLGDLLDATFTKYARLVTTPLISPNMEVLGALVAARMRYNAAGVTATVDPSANTITVRVASAATVPVTGACGGSSEFYAGQPISTVSLSAGGSATLSLSNGACAGGGGGGSGGSGGSTGAGGSGGSGASGGSGGSTGVGGQGGGAPGGSTLVLPCSALSVVAGQIGPGQSAAALTTAELTGTTDMWTNYVEVFPSSRIVCSYNLPAGVSAASVAGLSLDVNYRGPSLATQPWTFEVFDAGAGTWVALGDNGFAAGWVWTKHTFTLPAPLARFFSSGTLQIRYGTSSAADASDIDQLVIRAVTAGTTGAGGMTGAGGVTGTAGMTGAGGSRGGAGGSAGSAGGVAGSAGGAPGGAGGSPGGGTAFSLPCNSISVTAGQIGPGQTASALTTAELTGTTDMWTNYVEVFPSSRIVCSYVLPSGSAVTSLALQVNYRGPTKATQLWTFEAFDNGTGTWVALGDNAFAGDWVWTKQTFTLPAPVARFFSSGGELQIRYGTSSNADASDLDQLLITGTR
jgi:hypothetical protein